MIITEHFGCVVTDKIDDKSTMWLKTEDNQDFFLQLESLPDLKSGVLVELPFANKTLSLDFHAAAQIITLVTMGATKFNIEYNTREYYGYVFYNPAKNLATVVCTLSRFRTDDFASPLAN